MKLNEKLWDEIRKTYRVRQVSDDEIAVKCPLCGDSKKDPNKKRFHITFKSDRILYHCFNCGGGGLLDGTVISEMGIVNKELCDEIDVFLIDNYKGTSITYNQDGRRNYKMPMPRKTKNSVMKKNYINNRLGVDMSAKELVNGYHVIFDLGEFLKVNNIKPTINDEELEKLSEHYVGWINYNRNIITLRDVTDTLEARYMKYKIDKNNDSSGLYMINDYVDIMDVSGRDIHIAEGIMDIMGIHNHITDRNSKDYYVAVCGSGFENAIGELLCMGLFSFETTLNIYSDRDKPLSYYERLISAYSYAYRKIIVHYNVKEKDYGVTKDMIESVAVGEY